MHKSGWFAAGVAATVIAGSGLAMAQEPLGEMGFYRQCLELLQRANGSLATIAANTTPRPQVPISPTAVTFEPSLGPTCVDGLAQNCARAAEKFCRNMGHERASYFKSIDAPDPRLAGNTAAALLSVVCTSSPAKP